MPRTPRASAKIHVRRTSLPGVLGETIRQRWEEFRYPGFSPFALELVCFDLRLRVGHELTGHFARQPAQVQDALDRLLFRHYQPGARSRGVLIQAVQGRIDSTVRAAPRGEFARLRDYLRYSETLAPCIEMRWREAGYARFSDYVTGLLRYDLLLLGQHKYFNGDDTAPDLLAALDQETLREFHENRQPKRIYLDHLLEQRAGHPLTPADLSTRKHQLAEQILHHALEEDRQEKRR